MLDMKPFCAYLVIFCTVLVLSNGQRPWNWDQSRFGPGTRFPGRDSGDTNTGTDRRNFFGNNFEPGQMFPRRPPMGEGEGRGQGLPQPPPSVGQTPPAMGPTGGGGVTPQARPRQLPPEEDPGQVGRMPGMEEEDQMGAGQDEVVAPQLPPMERSPTPGQREVPEGRGPPIGSGPQPPVNRGPVGGPEEAEPEPPVNDDPNLMGQDPGMGQPPGRGQTEFGNPDQLGRGGGMEQGQFGGGRGQPPINAGPTSSQPPMTAGPTPRQPPITAEPTLGRPPMAAGPTPGRPSLTAGPAPGRPPLTPESQAPSPQPGMGRGGVGGPPMSQGPDDFGSEPEAGGGQEMLRSPQRPIRQGPDMGRQRRPMGQMVGTRQEPSTIAGQSQQRMGVQRGR